MLAFYRTAAHVERRGKPAANAEGFAARSGAHDVDDRVYRAHFVEVNLLDRDGVNRGFGLAQQLKGAAGSEFYGFRNRCGTDDPENRRKRSVLVAVLVMMVRRVLVIMMVFVRIAVRMMFVVVSIMTKNMRVLVI